MMKRIITVMGLLAMVSIVHAQAPRHLKGPAAKNYKPWQDKQQVGKIPVAKITPERLQGPAAKNQKAWEKNRNANYIQASTRSYYAKLKGPKYKNQKPGQLRNKAKGIIAEEDRPKKKEEESDDGDN
ncbi:MAG: hypothetical protein HRU41_22955 [Saprospiraceae bacterium]|nr:hypothetical protein [Saprospiraceae bacterium]